MRLTHLQKIVEDKKREVMSAHSEGLEKREDIGDDLLSILSQSSIALHIPHNLTSKQSKQTWPPMLSRSKSSLTKKF